MPKASFPDWIEREFKQVKLGDYRLNQRLQKIVTDLSQNPQATIPQASGTWARTKGAYRFFDHAGVTPEVILGGHQVATLERLATQKTVLLVQDTTSLNYACQQAASGLGSLGNRAEQALGLWLHTTLAVDERGTALGLMQARMWTRDPARAGVAARRKQRALAEKESQRWLDSFRESIRVAKLLPGSRVINVADREGDIYELFAQAAQQAEVGVLVRARHNRRLQQEEKDLWNFISAVEARQTGVSAAPAICWRLLTNQPVSDLAGAVEKVAWYRQRWRIEEFHRVLKTGCQAEARQLEKVERLKNVQAMDLIIAWRVLELTRLSRQSPDLSATELLTEDEVKVLCAMCKPFAGRSTLKLREAVRAIAQWGGFLARKSDGEPGPMTLWLGLLRLNDYVNACNIFSKTCG